VLFIVNNGVYLSPKRPSFMYSSLDLKRAPCLPPGPTIIRIYCFKWSFYRLFLLQNNVLS
jgi:hypothetical protein